MKTLAHISDLHFGREDPALVEGLLLSLEHARPDVIVVSGDLTQRARKSQFRTARAFLRRLPKCPHLVVPGNHDVSATNLLERLTRPRERYRRYITEDLSPFLDDPAYAISGINTVRLLAHKDGRINRRQVTTACEHLTQATSDAVRIVVTHHPMDLPIEDQKHALVVRSKMAMQAFSRCQVDLFLSGHLHAGQTIVTSTRHGVSAPPGTHYSAVVAQAGTAVSTRTRGEPNAWNLIQLQGRHEGAVMSIQQVAWQPSKKKFQPTTVTTFVLSSKGWCPA